MSAAYGSLSVEDVDEVTMLVLLMRVSVFFLVMFEYDPERWLNSLAVVGGQQGNSVAFEK